MTYLIEGVFILGAIPVGLIFLFVVLFLVKEFWFLVPPLLFGWIGGFLGFVFGCGVTIVLAIPVFFVQALFPEKSKLPAVKA